jgi:hypothetical protein
VQDDRRDAQPANGIPLPARVLSADRRSARAIRPILATAAWTTPAAVVVGVLIGVSGAGAGGLISGAALITMTIAIGAAGWMSRFQSHGERPFGIGGFLRLLTRRIRRSPVSAGTGRHALPTQWPAPAPPPTAQAG